MRPAALAAVPGMGAAVVPVGERGLSAQWLAWPDFVDGIRRIEAQDAPRWVWWPGETARLPAQADIRPARCWDLGAVHRMLVGGWRSTPAEIWAVCADLDPATAPAGPAPLELFSGQLDPGDPAVPIGADGHLRPEWVGGGWKATPERIMRWAELAGYCHTAQTELLRKLPDPSSALRTAYSESAAELLCAELEHDGLPIDVGIAAVLIEGFIGRRPTDAADEAALVAARDDRVLRHIPPDQRLDLRNPANVKALLRRVGIEVTDTRAWRLEELRDRHPFVDDLLTWRKAERIATTFGYSWLDAHVGADGRLRGQWSGSDGAAGRMTATAGLHNLPADLRPAIVAEPGHVFVRADLGQIEPRILAAVSGDAALIAATHDDDMYAPVAARLGVPREIAKVAVLGAMYGQTTGRGAEALHGLEAAYPVAMSYLTDAARSAEGGNDLRTRGGRLVRMSVADNQTTDGLGDRAARSQAAARGRYGRNAMVQGAAAEFFKTWAAIVRARLGEIDSGARIVLCLHDELLVHSPLDVGHDVAGLLDECVREAAHRWLGATPDDPARFVADVSVVSRWSDAK